MAGEAWAVVGSCRFPSCSAFLSFLGPRGAALFVAGVAWGRWHGNS